MVSPRTAYYRRNREKVIRANRNNYLKRTYGVTLEEYEAMVLATDSCCEICGRFSEKPHLDHCHKTGKVRGILCAGCNGGLGLFQDSPDSLTSAITYLAARR